MGNGRNLIDMVCEAFESQPGLGADGGGMDNVDEEEELFNFSESQLGCWSMPGACRAAVGAGARHVLAQHGTGEASRGVCWQGSACAARDQRAATQPDPTPASSALVVCLSPLYLLAWCSYPTSAPATFPPARHIPRDAAAQEGHAGQRRHFALLWPKLLRGARGGRRRCHCSMQSTYP